MVVQAQIIQAFAEPLVGERVEVHQGQVREKPSMSFDHADLMTYLGLQLASQLNRRAFSVHINHGRLRHGDRTYYIPDIIVIPAELAEPLRGKPAALEIYDAPLPLVVEIWSPSTGDYDVDAKIPAYMARGDLEIWRIQPYERTLTAWRRQVDGTYATQVYLSGTVQPVALPGVAVDLDALFG